MLNFKEDAKFASKYEIDILNKLTNLGLKYDDLVLLEKLSGEDYRKRVYIDKNTQIGFLEYDLLDLDWKFIPTPYFYMLKKDSEIIEINHTKRRLKGKYLPDNLVKDEYLQKYNEILLKKDTIYQPFLMRDAILLGIKRNGRFKIKDIKRKVPINIKTRDNFIKDNLKHLEKMVIHSKNILKEYIDKYKRRGYVINVSFSGGKDSAVSTLLTKDILKDVDVIFIDTHLEYDDTLKYVDKFAKEYDLNLYTVEGGNFWEYLDKEGIPTKDNRWCNSVCKLNLLRDFFKEMYPNKKILTIDGSRKFESFSRAKLGYIRKSSFIPFQTNLFPILDWNSLDVWMYIYHNNILYNPLYDEGFERIGCYLCPSALNSEFLRVKELYPDLWNKWVMYLKKYYSEDEILRGFWRWNNLPPKMNEIKKLLEL